MIWIVIVINYTMYIVYTKIHIDGMKPQISYSCFVNETRRNTLMCCYVLFLLFLKLALKIITNKNQRTEFKIDCRMLSIKQYISRSLNIYLNLLSTFYVKQTSIKRWKYKPMERTCIKEASLLKWFNLVRYSTRYSECGQKSYFINFSRSSP